MSGPPASLPAPKPTAASRLPSLNQLAARINLSSNGVATSSPSSSVSRPRLAASVLRTGSATSVATTASTNDSTAVNVSSTRPTSPLSTPPKSDTPSILEEGASHSDPLTTERLKELNQENAPTERKVKVGYKNIPSLDAITARLAKARSLSIDGSAKPPEAEMIEDPKTPGLHVKAPEHPLQYIWTIYHDTKTKAPFTPATIRAETTTDGAFALQAPESGDYEAGLTVIGEFDTVESFCRYFNWLKPPSKLERNSNYHLFKSGIKPMWEDEANARGGKWVLTMKNNPVLLDRCWSWLAMALVGEELEDGDEICGAVVSLRSKVDRIQVWTRSKDDVEKLNAMGKRLVKLLDVSEADNIGLEFQYNTDDRPLPNKFLSIQSMPTTSFKSTFGAGQTKSFGNTSPTDTPITANTAGGAFGNFSIGGMGSGWRGNKRA